MEDAHLIRSHAKGEGNAAALASPPSPFSVERHERKTAKRYFLRLLLRYPPIMIHTYSILCSLVVSTGTFLFGYDGGIISSVIAMKRFNSFFGNPSSSLTGAVVSTYTGGCFFGAAASGWLNDWFGRKRTIQIGCVVALFGCAMQTGSMNIATLLVGRIITGLAVGCMSLTIPLYNTEIAPPEVRGLIAGLAPQMIYTGVFASNWVGYGSQFIESNLSWRLPLGIMLIAPCLLLVGVHFMPRSPRWLLEHDKDDEARKVVYRLHNAPNPGSNSTRVSETKLQRIAEEEYVAMRDGIKAERKARGDRRISDLWKTRPMLKRTMVACSVQAFNNFTGANIVIYYGPKLFESLGLSSQEVLLVQGIRGAVACVGTLIFITCLIDRVGRKKPLVYGSAAFVITFAILAALTASFPPGVSPSSSGTTTTTNIAAQRAGVAMFFLITIIASFSFGPISWVLAAEVFPTRTRALGTALSTCFNWGFNALLSEVTPIALARVTWRFYLLFVFLNAFSFVIILLFYPETKGKTLEEMSSIFGDQVPITDAVTQYAEEVKTDESGSDCEIIEVTLAAQVKTD